MRRKKEKIQKSRSVVVDMELHWMLSKVDFDCLNMEFLLTVSEATSNFCRAKIVYEFGPVGISDEWKNGDEPC